MMTDSTRRLIQAMTADAGFTDLRRTVMALDDPIGEAPCDGCGQPVLYAWDDRQARIALEPDDAGGIAVELDGNQLPWCHPASAQLALGEAPYRLHAPDCRAEASITPISGAPSHPSHPASTRGKTA